MTTIFLKTDEDIEWTIVVPFEVNWHFKKNFFFFVSVKLVDVVVSSRFFRWAPMCFPSTSCSRHASTNGQSCITHPSKPSGTGLSYCWLSTRPSLRLMLPLSSSTSTILAARRARGTETIRSSSSTSWVTTPLPLYYLFSNVFWGLIEWLTNEMCYCNHSGRHVHNRHPHQFSDDIRQQQRRGGVSSGQDRRPLFSRLVPNRPCGRHSFRSTALWFRHGWGITAFQKHAISLTNEMHNAPTIWLTHSHPMRSNTSLTLEMCLSLVQADDNAHWPAENSPVASAGPSSPEDRPLFRIRRGCVVAPHGHFRSHRSLAGLHLVRRDLWKTKMTFWFHLLLSNETGLLSEMQSGRFCEPKLGGWII